MVVKPRFIFHPQSVYPPVFTGIIRTVLYLCFFIDHSELPQVSYLFTPGSYILLIIITKPPHRCLLTGEWGSFALIVADLP